MRAGLRARGFLRHRALILVAVGGTAAEAGLLTLVAPAARPVASQLTSLPVLAAYHDLRWLFTDGQPWPVFAVILLTVLALRSAFDTLLLRLAWPAGPGAPRTSGVPGAGKVFGSFAALTAVAWLLLTPVATLTFGAAVLPFSWPLLAALPTMIGMLLALSHGGILPGWWRRLPPPHALGWLLVSFAVVTAAAAVIADLGSGSPHTISLRAGGDLAVASVAGLVNARAWYGMARVAARMQPRSPDWPPAQISGTRILGTLPYAPIAAVVVLVLVVGVARLMFTGMIKIPQPPGYTQSQAGVADHATANTDPAAVAPRASAVLVVGGWGSACCDAADALRAVTPGIVVRQFSYAGLSPAGQPVPSGPAADDVPLPAFGDMMAAQLLALHHLTLHDPGGGRVAVVAESEGTLGVYAMLERHPGLPLGSVVLLSPIVDPGQVGNAARGSQGPVPAYALATLNHLVGGMSPYGPGGASTLLASVEEVGAWYFGRLATSSGTGVRLLAVIPLADALTLPPCTLSADVTVVPAFHGGLLGDAAVLPRVAAFLSGRPVAPLANSLRTEAELISSAAAAWRLPRTAADDCP